MSAAEWVSPLLSFAGAGLGAWLVYRAGRQQDQARRFQGALDMLASSDPRQRALGRARVVEICRQGSAGTHGRDEALAVLREDVRAACPGPVRQALEVGGADGRRDVWISEHADSHVGTAGVFVTRPVVESAAAYVDIAGGADAASDQVVVAIAQARVPGADDGPQAAERRGGETSAPRPLPADRRVILVKLSPDAANLGADALRERARRAWRLSIRRVESEPPTAVAAVAGQRVVGAWQYRGVAIDDKLPNRVQFSLGDVVADLVGCEYRDTGQNPVRYWP